MKAPRCLTTLLVVLAVALRSLILLERVLFQEIQMVVSGYSF